MFNKKFVFMTSLFLTGFINTSFGSDIKIYVSNTVSKCVSFNLVKIDHTVGVRQTEICPGSDGVIHLLESGQYKLFGSEVDTPHVNPYGDYEYINNPFTITENDYLAIYYPSKFISSFITNSSQ